MGLFDTLYATRSAQVKCWDSCLFLWKRGEQVPRIDDLDTYGIVLKEGGVALVKEGRLGNRYSLQQAKRMNVPLYDKYGVPWCDSDDYFF